MAKEKKDRLGRNGVEEILKHPFFAGLDTDKLLKKELEAPFKPKV